MRQVAMTFFAFGRLPARKRARDFTRHASITLAQ
jgi:hypothetical protein